MTRLKRKIIFDKIGLENFGSFYKYTEITFSTDRDRNVTLITGKIGSGKTTIFQLFWWVLFPEVDISTKKKKKKKMEYTKEEEMRFFRSKETINIVNNMAIKNAAIGEIITAKGYVKFNLIDEYNNSSSFEIERVRQYKKINEFEYSDSEYIDNRTFLEFVKDSDKITVKKNNGEFYFNDYLNMINDVLPPPIRNFVFIHGEGMTRILSIDNVGQLKTSVLTLSDYPKIKGLFNYLNESIKYFERKRKRFYSDNDDLRIKGEEIDREKEKLEKLYRELDKQEDFKVKVDDDLSEVEEDLAELDQSQEKLEKYHILHKKHADLWSKKYGKRGGRGGKAIKGLIKERGEKLMQYAPYIYLEDAITLCLFDITEKRNLGTIPGSSIPRQFLKMIFERDDEDGCICGVKPWTNEMRKNIMILMETAQDNNLIEIVNIFEGFLRAQLKRIDEGKKEIKRIQVELWDLNIDLQECKNQVMEFERNLTEEEKKEDAFKKIQDLNKKRDRLNQKFGGIKNKIDNLNEKIDKQRDKIKGLEYVYNKLEGEQYTRGSGKDGLYYKNIIEKLIELEELRKTVEERIENRIREETRDETEFILMQLVNDPDEWQNITIAEKGSAWEINAIFRDTPVKNISTGMTNVLGLSFIFALSNILGADLPIIFDSPLGNLDVDTRLLVTKKLPPIYRGRQIIFFEKKANFTVSKEETDEVVRLYPIIKEYIDYQYNLKNPSKISTKVEEMGRD